MIWIQTANISDIVNDPTYQESDEQAVIVLWGEIFAYGTAHNDRTIRKKLAISGFVPRSRRLKGRWWERCWEAATVTGLIFLAVNPGSGTEEWGKRWSLKLKMRLWIWAV